MQLDRSAAVNHTAGAPVLNANRRREPTEVFEPAVELIVSCLEA